MKTTSHTTKSTTPGGYRALPQMACQAPRTARCDRKHVAGLKFAVELFCNQFDETMTFSSLSGHRNSRKSPTLELMMPEVREEFVCLGEFVYSPELGTEMEKRFVRSVR